VSAVAEDRPSRLHRWIQEGLTIGEVVAHNRFWSPLSPSRSDSCPAARSKLPRVCWPACPVRHFQFLDVVSNLHMIAESAQPLPKRNASLASQGIGAGSGPTPLGWDRNSI